MDPPKSLSTLPRSDTRSGHSLGARHSMETWPDGDSSAAAAAGASSAHESTTAKCTALDPDDVIALLPFSRPAGDSEPRFRRPLALRAHGTGRRAERAAAGSRHVNRSKLRRKRRLVSSA